MAKNNNNSKATVQKLYDEVIPIVKTLAAQTADLIGIKEDLVGVSHTVDLADIKSDIKDIKTDMKSKISIKAFGAWLGSLSIIFGIIITIISLIFLR